MNIANIDGNNRLITGSGNEWKVMVNETKQSKIESFDKGGEGEKEVILEGKKRESRARRSGQKIRREREKDREYRKDARSAPEKDKFIITKFTNGDISRKYFDAVSKKKGNH